MKSASMKKTIWFAGYLKPVRTGVYKRKNPRTGGRVWSKWDDKKKKWLLFGQGFVGASKAKEVSSAQDWPWQGIRGQTVSPWFDGSVQPVRTGVYQRKELTYGGIVWSKWDNEKQHWMIGDEFSYRGARDMPFVSAAQHWEWRGLMGV